jgi:hypothetical protein
MIEVRTRSRAGTATGIKNEKNRKLEVTGSRDEINSEKAGRGIKNEKNRKLEVNANRSLDEEKAGHGIWLQASHTLPNYIDVTPLWVRVLNINYYTY